MKIDEGGIHDILDECIEAIRNGEKTVEECLGTYRDHRSELEPMLMAAARLIKAEPVTPNSMRKHEARARLIDAVERKRWEAGIERTPSPQKSVVHSGWRSAFMRLGIITMIFVLVSGTTLAMANDSMPGSLLYPVKIAMEKAQLHLARSDKEKSGVYLTIAEKRIYELRRLKENDDNYPAVAKSARDTIDAARGIAEKEGDKELKAALNNLQRRNYEVLKSISQKAPARSVPAIKRNNGASENSAGDTDKGRKNKGNTSGGQRGKEDVRQEYNRKPRSDKMPDRDKEIKSIPQGGNEMIINSETDTRSAPADTSIGNGTDKTSGLPAPSTSKRGSSYRSLSIQESSGFDRGPQNNIR